MTRTLVKLSKGALCVGALAACLASLPAQAQVEIQISPPSWFIATNRPVYYEGRPSYWYGNQWHYREGRTWRTYRSEPRYLRDQRMHGQSRRHDYGQERGYGQGRDSGRERDRGRDHD